MLLVQSLFFWERVRRAEEFFVRERAETEQPWGFFCGAEIRGAVVCFSGAENRGSLA